MTLQKVRKFNQLVSEAYNDFNGLELWDFPPAMKRRVMIRYGQRNWLKRLRRI